MIWEIHSFTFLPIEQDCHVFIQLEQEALHLENAGNGGKGTGIVKHKCESGIFKPN